MEQWGGRWNLVSQAPSGTAYSPARAAGIGTFLQGTSSLPGRKVIMTSTYSVLYVLGQSYIQWGRFPFASRPQISQSLGHKDILSRTQDSQRNTTKIRCLIKQARSPEFTRPGDFECLWLCIVCSDLHPSLRTWKHIKHSDGMLGRVLREALLYAHASSGLRQVHRVNSI